jgi:High potential iron-sulfur protein
MVSLLGMSGPDPRSFNGGTSTTPATTESRQEISGERWSRRSFLVLGVQRLLLGGAVFLAACDRSGAGKTRTELCGDPDELSAGERNIREFLAYTERSADPDKICGTCAFFEPGDAASPCGNCTVIDGPVNRLGYCKSWSPRSS